MRLGRRVAAVATDLGQGVVLMEWWKLLHVLTDDSAHESNNDKNVDSDDGDGDNGDGDGDDDDDDVGDDDSDSEHSW